MSLASIQRSCLEQKGINKQLLFSWKTEKYTYIFFSPTIKTNNHYLFIALSRVVYITSLFHPLQTKNIYKILNLYFLVFFSNLAFLMIRDDFFMLK